MNRDGMRGSLVEARRRARLVDERRARKRFRECRAEGRIGVVDAARALGLHKSTLSRFHDGRLDLSLRHVQALNALLEDVLAERIVLRARRPPPTRVAET
jgi:hypothetical protein